MSWEELYPIITESSYWAVLRYDPRRKDKIQELICQSYAKYQNDIARGKEIKKQDYKCFVQQRAKEVDKRSICLNGEGGTSSIDVLGFFRRRSEGTEIVEFDDWMTSKLRSKEKIEDQLCFHIDFLEFQKTLDELQKKILNYLMEGFNAKNISEMLEMAYSRVATVIRNLKIAFLNFFQPNVAYSTP